LKKIFFLKLKLKKKVENGVKTEKRLQSDKRSQTKTYFSQRQKKNGRPDFRSKNTWPTRHSTDTRRLAADCLIDKSLFYIAFVDKMSVGQIVFDPMTRIQTHLPNSKNG
jgi:hypothetical protein